MHSPNDVAALITVAYAFDRMLVALTKAFMAEANYRVFEQSLFLPECDIILEIIFSHRLVGDKLTRFSSMSGRCS